MSTENEKYEIGQTVKGVVTGSNSTTVYLEIDEGVKGVIYASEMLDKPNEPLYEFYKEGSEFKAQIKSISHDKKNPSILLLTLSTKMEKELEEKEARETALRERIASFNEIKDKDEIIKAKVVKVNKNNIDLSYNNTRLFLSPKLCSISEEALKKMKGETIDVIVIYVNVDHKVVAVSQIAAEKKERRLAKEAAYAAIEVGQELEGEVTSLLQYGAIVKLGEVSGLLHISEVSHHMVKDIKSVLKVGDKIKVKVIKKNEDKIGLSIRALTKHPWEILKEQYHVGDVFDGKVLKNIEAGVLIELTDEYSGLMPKGEYSWFSNEKLGELEVGSTLKVKVMRIDDEKKRVSLSHRATKENTWGSVKLRKGQVITVKVGAIKEQGATVQYENVEGFLPIREVTNAKRISSVSEVFHEGDEISVAVLEFDPSRARLTVSSKALEVAKERETFDKYMKQQEKEDTKVTLGDVFKDFEKEE